MSCCPTKPCPPSAPAADNCDASSPHKQCPPPAAPATVSCSARSTNAYYRVSIPQFSLTPPTWPGASLRVCQFNFTVPQPFTMNRPTKPASPTFIPVVRYRLADVAYRWKLWENAGEVLYLPLYNGETILEEFCFEIWTVNGSSPRSRVPYNLFLRAPAGDSKMCVERSRCCIPDLNFADIPFPLPSDIVECSKWRDNAPSAPPSGEEPPFFGSETEGFWSEEPVFGET